MNSRMWQPAFVGGLVMGVLSALPIISAGKLCCCLWVVSGGLVAAYLLQQNQSAPLSAGERALVGLMAGLVGAAVHFIVGVPIAILVSPMERAMFASILELGRTMPPEMRGAIESYAVESMNNSVVTLILRRTLLLFLMLFVGGIFSTLGGLLGAVVFSKRIPRGSAGEPPAVLP